MKNQLELLEALEKIRSSESLTAKFRVKCKTSFNIVQLLIEKELLATVMVEFIIKLIEE